MVIAILLGCNTNKFSKQERDLKHFYTTNFLTPKQGEIRDFRLVRFDTMTQLDLNDEQVSNLHDQFLEINISLKQITDEMASQLRMMELAGSARNKTEFVIAQSKMKVLGIDVEKLSVKADRLKAAIDSLNNAYLNADSTSVLGYQAVCYLKYYSPDNSVHSDTTYLFLDKNLDVIWRQDLFKTRNLLVGQ
jgi:hypothetical protein